MHDIYMSHHYPKKVNDSILSVVFEMSESDEVRLVIKSLMDKK